MSQPVAPSAGPSTGPKEIRKNWVLIIEDDTDLANMLKEELVGSGFKVLQCSNVIDAYRMLTNQRFNCIVLDMRLERGAGEQVVEFLKKDEHGFNAKAPIVVVSGELNVEVVKKIKAHVKEFFVKPFDLKVVVGKIKTICGV